MRLKKEQRGITFVSLVFLLVIIGFAALARTAWLQTRKRTATPAPDAAPETPAPPKPRSLVDDVALGLTIAMAVLAAFLLLAVSAVVIFFIICLAVLSSSGGFH